ncbi:MAG: hypothetical protein GY832_02645 [Chloroflexi bacterium]|nr:hypothetical protein [Chloroflexota bacterium]
MFKIGEKYRFIDAEVKLNENTSLGLLKGEVFEVEKVFCDGDCEVRFEGRGYTMQMRRGDKVERIEDEPAEPKSNYKCPICERRDFIAPVGSAYTHLCGCGDRRKMLFSDWVTLLAAEPKFKVGDRVKSTQRDVRGVIESIHDDKYCCVVDTRLGENRFTEPLRYLEKLQDAPNPTPDFVCECGRGHEHHNRSTPEVETHLWLQIERLDNTVETPLPEGEGWEVLEQETGFRRASSAPECVDTDTDASKCFRYEYRDHNIFADGSDYNYAAQINWIRYTRPIPQKEHYLVRYPLLAGIVEGE